MRRIGAAILVATVGLSLTACSSSGSKNAGSSRIGSTTSSSGTIKVFSIGQLQATNFAFPDIETGLKAAATAINTAGGINGQKIEVTVCNDAGNTNQAAACARQAVTGKYVAVVGGLSLYYDSIFPILEQAKIPVIGESPLNTLSETSSISFPVDSNPSTFVAQGIALVKDKGCQKVAIINSNEATTQASANNIAQGIKWAGGSVVKDLPITTGTADLAPTVSSAIGAGANCFATALAPADLVKAITAIRSSTIPAAPIGTTVGSIPLAIVTPLGKAAEGIIETNNNYAVTSDVWATAIANMKKLSPSVPIENYGLVAYSMMYVFDQIAKSVTGDITKASIMTAAAQQTGIKGLGYPSTVDFSKPGPGAGVPRLFNTKVLVYTIKNGTYDLASPDPIDVSAAYAVKI